MGGRVKHRFEGTSVKSGYNLIQMKLPNVTMETLGLVRVQHKLEAHHGVLFASPHQHAVSS